MKTILALLLFLVSGIANAASARATAGGESVTITDEKCTNPAVLGQIPKLNALLNQFGKPAASAADLRAGTLVHQGKMYGTCWALIDGVVVVVDEANEDTSIFAVPASAFKVVQDI